jgi:rhodanese-related sulfurtransferase
MIMVKWKAIFKEAAAIVLIAVALAGIGYILRPNIIPSGDSDQSSGANVDGQSGLTNISLEDAREHFEKGTALFVDARPKGAYATGHIKGAINLDPDEFDAWSGNFFSQVPQDRAVIVYCEQEQYRQSVALAEKLTWMGYEKIYGMKNGWGLWKENRLPIDRLGK